MYETFSGVIPKGEYGGGTMTIWDRGRYDLLKAADGPKAIEEGKLEIHLRGRKLRGEWHLVKTRSEKDQWILFKARDRYARGESEKRRSSISRRRSTLRCRETIEPMRAGRAAPFSDPPGFSRWSSRAAGRLRKEAAESSSGEAERISGPGPGS
jgi:bifunctional non-homologous end joining protein LigD